MHQTLQPAGREVREGLRERVHGVLRRAIIAGRLTTTGGFLNERQTAARLGISTTPLKEALRRLEAEGLVVTVPRRGVRVTFDAARAEEMSLARAALESMIARVAAARIGDAALAALDGVAGEMRDATAAGDVARLIALNGTFHEAIHLASGCDYLRRLLQRQLFYDQATREFLLSDPEERGRALAEHLRILAALAARDENAAETAMRDHVVRSGRQHVRAAFARRETLPGGDAPEWLDE